MEIGKIVIKCDNGTREMARMAEEDSKKRLGRGLAALIGDIDAPATSWQGAGSARPDRKIPIEHVQANIRNPRNRFDEDELEDLSRSIREHGIVQPILVRPIAGAEKAVDACCLAQ